MVTCPSCDHALSVHSARDHSGYLVAAECWICGCRWKLDGTGWLD
jgi:transcription elongation factor Elf1